MLELLAGPFAVKTEGGLETSISNGIGTAWVDGLGIVTAGSTANVDFRSGVVKMDGTFYPRAYGFDLNKWLGLDPMVNSLLRVGQDSNVKPFNPVTMCSPSTVYFTTDFGIYAYQVVRLQDRILRLHPAGLIQYSTNGGSTWTTEQTLVNVGSTWNATLTAYGNDLYIGLAGEGNNRMLKYNMLTKTQYDFLWRLDHTIPSGGGMWYSLKHNVVISKHWAANVDYIRIWSTTPKPATLATPTALTPLAKAKVSTIRTRLTGSYGEACAGELIEWSLVGAGTLLKTYSTTDAQGYATVDYAAPVDSLPSPQITATMRF